MILPYIFTVSNKQITTTNKDKTQVQRPKKQIYEIPTFENKKIVLNVKNGNVYIMTTLLIKVKI